MSISRVKIYRSEQGQTTMEKWYQDTLDGLTMPYDTQMVDTRFGPTHVLSVGPKDGMPVFCLHGAMSAGPHALTQVEPLAKTFRLHFPDIVGQPGRSAQVQPALKGEPYGHWAIDVMDGLGLEKVATFGASMGAFVLIRAATIAPERISKMVLWTPGGLVHGKALAGMKLSFAMMRYQTFGSPGAIKTILDTVSHDMPDHWRAFYQDSFRYVKLDTRMPQNVGDDELAQFDAPVMLVAHALDPLFPADKLQQRAKQVFSNLQRVDIVEGVSHVPPYEMAKRQPILDGIEAFLQTP